MSTPLLLDHMNHVNLLKQAQRLQTELQQAQAALAALQGQREGMTDTMQSMLARLETERAALAAVALERDEAKEEVDASDRHNVYTLQQSLHAAKTIAEMEGEDPTRYFASMHDRIWFLEMAKQLAACQSREAKALEGIETRDRLISIYQKQYSHHNTDFDDLKADRDQLQAQVGALRGALGLFDVWPLHSVLGKLCEAVRHMKEAHDCDGDSHEQFYHALGAGERLIPTILAALAQPAPAEGSPAAPDSAQSYAAKDGARLWDELRRRCCVNPDTAVRCVMVTEEDLKAAMAATPPWLKEHAPSSYGKPVGLIEAFYMQRSMGAPAATEVHHRKKRRGALLCDTRYFLAVCSANHARIEANLGWARKEGFSLNF